MTNGPFSGMLRRKSCGFFVNIQHIIVLVPDRLRARWAGSRRACRHSELDIYLNGVGGKISAVAVAVQVIAFGERLVSACLGWIGEVAGQLLQIGARRYSADMRV